jgi:hypothetical protein
VSASVRVVGTTERAGKHGISEAPWRAGVRAARANVVPGLIVQGVMLGLLLSYYGSPGMRGWLLGLAELKLRWGYGYSGVASVVAGALLPEVLRIGVFQKLRGHRGNLRSLVFTIPFWCVMGIMVDALYRSQAAVFGTAVDFKIVAVKVAIDQFIYSPLVSGPLTVWFYAWKNSGRPPGPRQFFTVGNYRREILPVVMAIWGVWLPIVTILYCLPEPLQIPMFALALTLWVMLYTWMSEERGGVREIPAAG